MTDETVPPAAPVVAKKRGGWPKGKRRVDKPKPPTPAEVKAIADRAAAQPRAKSLLAKMKARPNWDDDTVVMVGEEGTDRLRIPRDIIDRLAIDGVALQWITRSVRGLETPQEIAKFVKGGWTPVHQSDFDGVLDGMFLPKGLDEVITQDDCLLVARPMSIHKRARERERALAREPLAIKQAELGQGLPVSGGNHPSVHNSINVTRERIEIPE